VWRGDFQNARKVLQAMARRLDRRPAGDPPRTPAETFHRHRAAQAIRARTLGMLLLTFDADHRVPNRRAPDVRQACVEDQPNGKAALKAAAKSGVNKNEK